MKGSNVFRTNVVQTTLPMPEQSFSSFQLTYTTAEIERSIFYGEYGEPSIASKPAEPSDAVSILVVHGDMFILEQTDLPYPAVPLTEQSGLFRIVNLPGDVAS